LFIVIPGQQLFLVAGETALVLLCQFSDTDGFVFDAFLADYLYFNNIDLSEPPKSVNWAGLFHFSFEVLGGSCHSEAPATAFRI
jgi:hypothetical protein